MITSYQEIYGIFINKITDFNFINLSEEDIESLCLKYLISSTAKFSKCKKDLTARDDETQTFFVKLDGIEKEILATMMIVEWLTPQVYNIMNLKQFLGDQEYKHYSQANHLEKLMLLRETAIEEGDQLMTAYTYTKEDLQELK